MRARLTVPLFFVLAAAGCYTSSSGPKMAPEDLATIQKGKTTEADLVRMFGEPQSRFVDAQGIRHLSWGSVRATVPLFIGMGSAGQSTRVKTLAVTLGPDGTVTDYTMGESSPQGVPVQ